jgi:carbamate kinase
MSDLDRPGGLLKRRQPLAVVALGGNALLHRGEPPEAASQVRAARVAAGLIAKVIGSHQIVVTHGNGPQVGLLALMSAAYMDTAPYPLDVLDSETEGQIGYVLELELANAIPDLQTVTLLTRIVVDAADPAFSDPAKFVGPQYSEVQAHQLGQQHGWVVKPDGPSWRRVVASPEPQRIVQLDAIRQLSDAGFIVICVGGGGIPVLEAEPGRQQGVEAVIDKDLASALLAGDLGVETLVLVTDVDGVYVDYGTPAQRAILQATPAGLRSHQFVAGSMGPKVEAVCRFVERTGGRGVIGRLDKLDQLFTGKAGTQVLATGPEISYGQRQECDDRAA